MIGRESLGRGVTIIGAVGLIYTLAVVEGNANCYPHGPAEATTPAVHPPSRSP